MTQPATPAGPAPATDRNTLRERIATAVDRVFEAWRQGLGDTRPQDAVTDAVLAVLLGPIPADTDTATWTAIRAIQLMNEARAAVPPAPDQQAAVWLDAATRLWHQTTGLTEYGRGARWAIGELRRLAGEAQQAPCGRPASMATTPCSAGDHCCEGPSEAQQDPTQAGPRRGDQFEQWLTAQRDAHRDTGHGVWSVLDTLLDQYRQHADTSTPLGEHVSEGRATDETQQGPTQDGEEATPNDQAGLAAGLRAAADEIAGIDFHPNARARSLDIAAGLSRRLRCMADELQPTPAQDGKCGAREPEPRTGTSPCVLPAGHGGTKHQDKWTNQWPIELVARSGQPETELRCVCGDPIQLQDDTDPTSWIHSPGSDTPCLHAHPSR